MDCGYAAVDESYRSYLFDYYFDEEMPEEEGVCITRLGFNQAIVYYRVDENDTLGDERELGYDQIPKCYALMTTQDLEASGVTKVRRNPQLGYDGRGTLIAVIDTGIDLKNPAFVYEDGSVKLEAIWDQTDQTGTGPAGFSFGREWSREELETALKEDFAGLPGDENGHGTFLAAVAAGRQTGEFSGTAPAAGLLVVKLKQAKRYLRKFYSLEEGVWACQEDDLMLAVKYVIEKAGSLGKPVSVCLGVGTNLGGHAGTGALERYLSAYALLPGISFHVAGGNEGIANHHFSGSMGEKEEYAAVRFHAAEGEKGFVMELWGADAVTYSVGVISPGKEAVERLRLRVGEFRSIRFFPEKTVLQVRSYTGDTAAGAQVIRMNFTDPAPGVWELQIYGEGIGAKHFDLWLPVSNFLKEETFFLNADPFQTVTSPGNAFYTITYAPYDVRTESLYVRAGRGYTRDNRVVPDLAAPGVSVEIPGRNERKLVRSGSSVAAAFGAGIGAMFQQWAIVEGNEYNMNSQMLRYHLIQGAVRFNPYSYPNQEWGYGVVNVYDAFLALRL